MISHTERFGIYHWDTFDNVTLLIDEANTPEEARAKIKDRYGGRVHSNGADRVEIVDIYGNVIQSYRVG